MIHIEFTEEDIQALNYERYHHPHPQVQRKMEALWLKSQGLAHKDIARLTNISPNTSRQYFRDYAEGGIQKLKEVNHYKPKSELESHKTSIEEYFREHPPASIPEAVHRIEQLTGIKRSPTQVRQFLKSIGMERRKVGMIPSKADTDEQEAFKKEKLEPRLAEAKSGQRAVFFMDAAHFVLAPFLGFLWCFTRLFIQAPAGRKRFNVLSVINAITHELITITNDTYINAQNVCQLLLELASLNLGIPITIILDNARYQRSKLVQELARSLNIELLYLPAYSPNLNLIERLWKFVKKQCLYSRYYSDFKVFKGAISNCLSQTQTIYKEDLDSLLTLRFQTFEKAQFVSV